MRLLGYLAASVSGKPCELPRLAKKGTAVFSRSKNIYRNLALEQWIYERVDFEAGSPGLLLMWANGPAVVIGRHQNPWVECSLSNAARFGVDVARRNSGGGAVYHDPGNLNCCFLGHKRDYDRKANLRLVCEALRTSWGVDASITSRDDVLVQDAFKIHYPGGKVSYGCLRDIYRMLGHYKDVRRTMCAARISGTASKIGHQKAYHHFTLLVDVNTTALHQVLGGHYEHIDSKATSSVKASVRNLKEICPGISVEPLAESIGLAHQARRSDLGEHQIHTIEPTEENFPGIDTMCAHLQSWDWVFGMTPRFTIKGSFQVPLKLTGKLDLSDMLDSRNTILSLSVSCYHGKVTNVGFVPNLADVRSQEVLQSTFVGVRFVREDLEDGLRKMLAMPSKDSQILSFVGQCVLTLAANALR